MADIADVMDALMTHVAAVGTAESVVIAWENVEHPGTVPRIEVQHFGGPADYWALTNGVITVSGLLQLTVVVSSKIGTIRAMEIVETIRQQFAVTVKLFDPEIRFRPVQVGPGLPDGNEFRVPVSVRYVATLEG